MRQKMKECIGQTLFQEKNIRRIWYVNEWWFSVADIIRTVNDKVNIIRYLSELKTDLTKEGFEVSDFIMDLELTGENGRSEITDCTTMINAFRIIQSVHSKNAEPFKIWLAEIGAETLQDMQDPERMMTRVLELYKAKGYSKKKIERKLRGLE